MLKISSSVFFVLLVGALAWFGLPWWTTALAGGLASVLFRLSPRAGFLSGFAAGYLLWWGFAMLEHVPNAGILATRVGGMLKGLKPWHLLAFTGFLGGLLGGLGGLVGGQLRDVFQKK